MGHIVQGIPGVSFSVSIPTQSNRGMVPIQPEFPNEQGPELFSIILLVGKMIAEKTTDIIRIEKPLLSDSVVRKQIPEQLS